MDDPAKDWMFVNGSVKAGATRLKPQELSPFEKANNTPPTGPADKTMSFVINQTDIVTWVIDRAPFKEPDIPIIYGEISSGWNSNTTMHLPLNSTIDIILNISNRSMDTVRCSAQCTNSVPRLLTTGRWATHCTFMVISSGYWVLAMVHFHTKLLQTHQQGC